MDAAKPSGERALALESLLRWYAAMGVDLSLDEEPHDRFSPEAASPPFEEQAPNLAAAPRSRLEPPPLPAARPTGTAEDMIRTATAMAATAETLADLRARLDDVPGCGLRSTAARMVFAGGNPRARLMIVGGAPSADDERGGTTFSGAQGSLMDAMLAAIGLSRDDAYLTYVVPWRPPGNRAPTPLELALCLPFARRHIELVTPACILCLGERAAQPLLESRDPISRLRGRWFEIAGVARKVKALVTFAPDFLQKQPLQKRRVWSDLLVLERELG